MSKCSNCGTKNEDEARFCCNCGSSLNSNANSQQFSQKDNSTNMEKPKNKTKLICFGIIIVIVLIAIIGFSNGGKESSIYIEDIPIPSDFEVDYRNQTDLAITKGSGKSYLSINVFDEDQYLPEEVIEKLEKNGGCILQNTDVINIYNKNIKEEKLYYGKKDAYVYVYTIPLGDKNYTVACITPNNTMDITNTNNSVNQVLKSMIDLSKNSGKSSNNRESNTNNSENTDAVFEALEENRKNQDPSLGLQVKVIYPGKWTGTIYDSSTRSISGTGTKTFDIENEYSRIDVSATKKDGSNEELTVQILKNGIVMEESSTTAEYGYASVSANPELYYY